MGTIRPQVVLFGDSLTEFGVPVDQTSVGWVTSVTNYYNRKADVVLRGLGGYNTRLARILLEKIFPKHSSNPPLLVTVFFGANDAADPDANHAFLHVPLAEYIENIHKIVAYLKELSESTKVILIAPPPISEKNLLKFAQIVYQDTSGIPTRTNDVIKLYAQECVKVGRETNVPVIDLWSIFQETPDWEEKFFSDGLHLSAQGNAKVFEELLKALDLVPTVKVDQLRWDFPFGYDFLGKDAMEIVEMVKTWCTEYNI